MLLAVLVLAGCGSDTTGESSNRGSGSETTETTVENAFVVPRYLPGSCAIQVGSSAELRFTVTNNRPVETERLEGISTPAADSVRIAPDPPIEVAAGTSIAAGQPVAQGRPFTVTLEGTKDSVQPAHSVDVTFRFEKSGDITMLVPVEACPTQE
ncbi:hypothetical protein [Mycobacterium sp. GA-1285]|uniref:hypothetical protein n=1 Tax=Mycobacterium sp. GA-1285 TaxID=1772282 RepID=UPI000A91E490|nr:hypothetical protein [Mycobacterium sp. GA-1285]